MCTCAYEHVSAIPCRESTYQPSEKQLYKLDQETKHERKNWPDSILSNSPRRWGGVYHIIPRHAYVHGGHYSMQHGGEGDGMRGIELHTNTSTK